MIHSPKRIVSYEGLGLNTAKDMEFLTDTLAIGTETWSKLETPWQEGETIIANEGYVWRTRWEAGKPYLVTKFYNATGEEVGIYCDVARPVERIAGGFAFDDLYLDVWQVPGNPPVLLDEDELAEALEAGYINQTDADVAFATARQLLAILGSGTIQLDSLNS
jgi:predicted RNA-binding protein associated with RNAse of E/G family